MLKRDLVPVEHLTLNCKLSTFDCFTIHDLTRPAWRTSRAIVWAKSSIVPAQFRRAANGCACQDGLIASLHARRRRPAPTEVAAPQAWTPFLRYLDNSL